MTNEQIPGPGDLEDPRVVLVRDPNDRSRWREAKFGFDSDVAKLADKIHHWISRDERDHQDRAVTAISDELAAAEDAPIDG